VPGDREDLVLAALSSMYLGERSEYSLNGIVLTGRISPSRRLQQILSRTSIPVIAVSHDSYAAAARISDLTAKLTPRDGARIDRAKAHIRQHVDTGAILNALD
jgi:BioD-like phosphotransacetylase family protein